MALLFQGNGRNLLPGLVQSCITAHAAALPSGHMHVCKAAWTCTYARPRVVRVATHSISNNLSGCHCQCHHWNQHSSGTVTATTTAMSATTTDAPDMQCTAQRRQAHVPPQTCARG
eukprot:353568-Chlamydomonas_euryale.AAC.5